MELKDIYTGLQVKHKRLEGKFEIIRIDDFSMSIWCRPLNSIDNKLKEFKAEDLEEIRGKCNE